MHPHAAANTSHHAQKDAEEHDHRVKTLWSLLERCVPEYDPDTHQIRLGTYHHDQKRPRPIHLYFGSLENKHAFLKDAKGLKEVGLRYDDDLTRLQHNQRFNLSATSMS